MILKNPERMMDEWWRLEPKLRLLICDIDLWCREKGVTPVWTCFLRTDQEQLDLVDSGASRYPHSVHEYGRGADMRRFEDDELNDELLMYVNRKFPYGDGLHMTGILHNGTAQHFHFQVRA